jgi:hypothetical protein
MFPVIGETVEPQPKRRFESCYGTSIDFTVYPVLLFLTEVLISYRRSGKVFANDYESKLVYQQPITLKQMVNRNELIKTLNTG